MPRKILCSMPLPRHFSTTTTTTTNDADDDPCAPASWQIKFDDIICPGIWLNFALCLMLPMIAYKTFVSGTKWQKKPSRKCNRQVSSSSLIVLEILVFVADFPSFFLETRAGCYLRSCCPMLTREKGRKDSFVQSCRIVIQRLHCECYANNLPVVKP